MGTLRRRVEGATTEAQSTEHEQRLRVQEALQGKHAFIAREEKEVEGVLLPCGIVAHTHTHTHTHTHAHTRPDLKDKLQETTQGLKAKTDELTALQAYKQAGQYDLDKEIDVLRQTVDDINETYSLEVNEITERFERAKQRFTDNLEARLELARSKATDHAIMSQQGIDRVQIADREWLKKEIDTHAMEGARLEYECNKLEEENLRMLRSMYNVSDDVSLCGCW